MPKSLIVWLWGWWRSEVLIRRTITIKGSPRLQNPRIPNFIITQFFLDNVLPASVEWIQLLSIRTSLGNMCFQLWRIKWISAIKVMLKLKDYNGPHIDAKAVEDYKLVFEFLTCPCVEAGGVCFYLQRSYFRIPNTCRYWIIWDFNCLKWSKIA